MYDKTCGILLTGHLSVVWVIESGCQVKNRGNIEWPSEDPTYMYVGRP